MNDIAHPIEGVAYGDEALAARYLASGAWVDATVGTLLRERARLQPQAPAFITPERSIGFGELDASVDRLGGALLALGLQPGERAIFQMGTGIETAVALLACYRAGLVPVCAIPQYREAEIGQLLAQSQASVYLVQGGLGSFDLVGFALQMQARHPSLRHVVAACVGTPPAGVLAQEALAAGMDPARARTLLEQAPPQPRDVLSFQLSGGTTGVPKIIPRFHAEYLGHSLAWARQFGLEAGSRLVWPLPLMHNAGQLYALLPPLLCGSATVMMPRPDVPLMLELIERHQVTHGLSIGPVAPQLLAYQDIARHDLSSLRLFGTMSGAERVEAHLGVPCANFYGITEGLLIGSSPDSSRTVRHGTQGRSACPDDELVLLAPGTDRPAAPGEMGELCFRGPSSLRAYYAAPQASAEALTTDGFVRSGDLMSAFWEDGACHYRFEGRLRDNINRGGEKIACEEVEAVLGRHPAVADAKVVAMPDPVYGEKACAFLILRPGHDSPSVAELGSFVTSSGLAKFKSPERVEVLEAFPVTRVGKLDKPALRHLIAQKLKLETGGGEAA